MELPPPLLLVLPRDEDPLDEDPLEEDPLEEDPLEEDPREPPRLPAMAPPPLPLSRTMARRTKATISARKSAPLMLEAV